jgi:membrane protease YdiL (CAAX protease family)
MIDKVEIKQKELIMTVVVIESLLFIFACVLGYFTRINQFSLIKFDIQSLFYSVLFTLILLGTSFLAINILSKYIKFFKNLKHAYDEIAPISANISFGGALIISLFSGFAEEFLFRGVLQSLFGLIIASIIFGLFHVSSKKTLSYGLYTIIIGFYFGFLYYFTGNLLVPIIVHCLNNFLSLFYMRYYYKKYINK